MKKIITLVMFTFLALVGYYIGVAVAQNNNDATPNGTLVIEEEYDAVATPDSQPTAKSQDNSSNDTPVIIEEETVSGTITPEM